MDFDFLPKLPKSNLDDRTFEDLVEECILRIPRYCPEWTNHNPGDPGITLIELFAWLTDQMLLRFNQVPRRNYVGFLELLGIRLQPPQPAKCELTFYLSQPQQQAVIIPSGTEAATVRTETEEAVIFTTDRELIICDPQIQHLLTATRTDGTPSGLRSRTPFTGQWRDFEETPLFERSLPQDSFYLVLEPPANGVPEEAENQNLENLIKGNVLAITFRGEAATTTGINPDNPPLRWSAWNGREWEDVLRVKEDDKTKGFSFSGLERSPSGIQEADVLLHLPQDFPRTDFDGYSGHWIRCTYIDPEESQDRYVSSPRIVGLSIRSLGAKVNATECVRMENELLGISTGKPGQSFELQAKPVLTRSLQEHIRIKLPGTASNDWRDWEPWFEVQNFAKSNGDSKDYTIDSQEGTVQFGPLIREPSRLKQLTRERSQIQPAGRIVRRDNSRNDNLATYVPREAEESGERQALERQYGKVPPPGAEIYMVSYRTGGGSRGNVKTKKINFLKTSIPYVKSVINHQDATGGTDPETLDEAVLRVPQLLRTRECAVIPEDYERIAKEAPAKEAKQTVARAYCLRNHNTAGIVRLLIVPNAERDLTKGISADRFALTEPIKRDILGYMQDRKPLGIQVKLEEPEYIRISVRVEVILEPNYNNNRDRSRIQTELLTELYRFLNPLTGGFEGKGWELGRPVYASDIVALSRNIKGIRYLGFVELFGWRKYDEGWVLEHRREQEIFLPAIALACSWQETDPQLTNGGHIIEFRD